jgi:hypothetical protein
MRKITLLMSTIVLFLLASLSVSAYSISISSPTNGSAISGSTTFTVAVSGNFTAGINLTLPNGTIVNNNTANLTTYLFVIATTGLSDNTSAVFIFNATGNAGVSNTTSASVSVVVDNTVPIFNLLTLDKTSVEYGDPVSISCLGNDSASSNFTINISITIPEQTSTTSIASNSSAINGSAFTTKFTETRLLGNFLVQCNVTDLTGNTNNTNKTFNVKRKLHRSAAPPSTVGTIGKKIITSNSISNVGTITATGTSRLMAKRATMKFDLADGAHSLYIDSLTETSAKFIVTSEPQEFELSSGSSKDIDVDADGTNDIKITLHSISSGKADVTIATSSPSTIPQEEETTTSSPSTPSQVTIKEEKSYTWLWISILIIIILLLLFIFLRMRKPRGPSFSSRDLGNRPSYPGPELQAPRYPTAPGLQRPPQQPPRPMQPQPMQPPQRTNEKYANAPYNPPRFNKKPEKYY